jgi:hypothetical protein
MEVQRRAASRGRATAPVRALQACRQHPAEGAFQGGRLIQDQAQQGEEVQASAPAQAEEPQQVAGIDVDVADQDDNTA